MSTLLPNAPDLPQDSYPGISPESLIVCISASQARYAPTIPRPKVESKASLALHLCFIPHSFTTLFFPGKIFLFLALPFT